MHIARYAIAGMRRSNSHQRLSKTAIATGGKHARSNPRVGRYFVMNSAIDHLPALVARVLPRQGAKRRAETSLYKGDPGVFNDRPFRLPRSSNPNPAAAISAAAPGSGVMERLFTDMFISLSYVKTTLSIVE